jgi:hypothetical protein
MSFRYGWSLDKSDWDNVMHLIRNDSWSRRALRAEIADLPEKPGLYLICAKMPGSSSCTSPFNKFLAPVYIGHSENLRSRFQQHVYGYGSVRDAKKSFGELYFYFNKMPKMQKGDLKDLETKLLIAFGPSANKNYPQKPVLGKLLEPVPLGTS